MAEKRSRFTDDDQPDRAWYETSRRGPAWFTTTFIELVRDFGCCSSPLNRASQPWEPLGRTCIRPAGCPAARRFQAPHAPGMALALENLSECAWKFSGQLRELNRLLPRP